MSQELMKDAQYYPKKSLILRRVIEGAQMWSVALERTMFTFFEIEPNSCFDVHSHINEQITMVLEGELSKILPYGRLKNGLWAFQGGNLR